MPEVGSRVQISSAPKAWSCGRENAIDAEQRLRSAVRAIEASGIAARHAARLVVGRACARLAAGIELRRKVETIIVIASELAAPEDEQFEHEAWAIIVPKI
jgi:hypothetical protein